MMPHFQAPGPNYRQRRLEAQVRWWRSWGSGKRYRPGKQVRGQGRPGKTSRTESFPEDATAYAWAWQEAAEPGANQKTRAWHLLAKTFWWSLKLSFIHLSFLEKAQTWLPPSSTMASCNRRSCNLNFIFSRFIYLKENSLWLSAGLLSISRGHCERCVGLEQSWERPPLGVWGCFRKSRKRNRTCLLFPLKMRGLHRRKL